MGQPSLTMKNGKETEFLFNVSIQGASSVSEASVRFIIDTNTGYQVSLVCENVGGTKWMARVPANVVLPETTLNFKLEVITGDYFFCPAIGTLTIVPSTSVQVSDDFSQSTQSRPMVSAAAIEMSQPVYSPSRQMVAFESLEPLEKTDLLKRCYNTGKIFSRAGEVMQSLATNESKVTGRALNTIVEMVKTANESFSTKLWL